MRQMSAPVVGDLSRVEFRFERAGDTETKPEVIPDKPEVDDPGTGPGGVPNDPGNPSDPGGPGRRHPPNCPTTHPGKSCP